MEAKLEELVRNLNGQALEELKKSVLTEIGNRREQTAIQLEHIHPRMSEADKEQAAQEIARVLRGEF